MNLKEAINKSLDRNYYSKRFRTIIDDDLLRTAIRQVILDVLPENEWQGFKIIVSENPKPTKEWIAGYEYAIKVNKEELLKRINS